MGEFAHVETPRGVYYTDISTGSTSTTLVNSVTGKSIVVLSVSLVCNSVVSATFQSSTGPTAIGGPYYCAANGGIVLPHNIGGWFKTAAGDSLKLALSGSVNVGGSLSYTLV